MKLGMSGILFGLLELVLGILLLANPVGFTSGILVAFGILLCVTGVVSVVKYFLMEEKLAAKEQGLFKGLVCLTVGLLCSVKTKWLVSTFPLLTVIYGVIILIVGLSKVQLTFDVLRAKKKHWYLAAIGAVISLVCAAVILLNPFASTVVLWKFTGITIIIEAVWDLITVIINRKQTN